MAKTNPDLASIPGWKQMSQAAGLDEIRKRLERLRRETQDKEGPAKKNPKGKRRVKLHPP